MQVLALTTFLAVSLPVEYYETVNGLQWLIPHVTTPWQKNEDVNFTTSFATANVQTNLTLSIRRSLMLALHFPTDVGELQQKALFSECMMMRQWPAQYVCASLKSLLYSRRTFLVSINNWLSLAVSLSEMLTFGTLLQGTLDCSLYSESLATTYWSGTHLENLLLRKQGSYESLVQGRRRLGANGTQYGPAMTAQEYESYFLVSALNPDQFAASAS